MSGPKKCPYGEHVGIHLGDEPYLERIIKRRRDVSRRPHDDTIRSDGPATEGGPE